ncbi:MAG: outer membrane beta-barrel protein [Deltaproteobacteria bacterium]|nr:outer membrane beta-barrel protein [Deltaproteobacteria bacterium]
MKNILSLLLLFLTLLIFSQNVQARHGYAFSAYGGGAFSLTNTFPDLDMGAGGGIALDWRFNQRWALSTRLAVFEHDGEGLSKGNNGMLFLNLPDVLLKFHFFGDEKRFDPYALAGIGLGVLTGGSKGDNSAGAGLTATVGIGADYYLSDSFSLGLSGEFKTFGLIRSDSESSALIFISALGHVSWHFK